MTSMPVQRADPAKISTTLKEAVVDALLNLTYAQVSGQGPNGKFVFGARPRLLLNSGFLLPQKKASGDDEVTSPIWISSHGLQLQIAEGVAGAITVVPQVSVYVRVLPRQADLARPNCRPFFKLRGEVQREVRDECRKRLDEEWEKVKSEYKSRFKHPEWKQIREKVTHDVYTKRGIPRGLIAAAPASEEGEEAGSDTDTLPTEGAVPPADTALPIKDEHFEPLSIPHKWMRFDMRLSALELDGAMSADELQTVIDVHAGKMNAEIEAQLKAWSESDEPDFGGKAWGFRQGLQLPASKYRNWAAFLEEVRKSQVPIATPTLTLGWDLDVSTDWLDKSRRNFFLAIANRSQMPARRKEETEEAVFVVSFRLEMPVPMHRPLKLERVEPSYRYNQFLSYPAIGHNGGVKVLVSKPGTRIFETTWTPRYIQPRIVPTTVASVQRRVRALARPDCLDGLSPLVPAMQAWLDNLPANVNPADGLSASDVAGIARETKAFEEDQKKWAAEIQSIKAGLDILTESASAWKARGPQSDPKAAVFEAWLGMNEAMANFMKLRFGKDENEWRLFQLAFIIANIPTLASRLPQFQARFDPKRDDAVTLLYFATGGGKSEAFFGLLVFNLLLDRLRGKHIGVTALIRYPLRLLTIQQAQRCAKVLAQAELVREKYSYGGCPLSIGFWVGSGGSPNRHSAKGVRSIPSVSAAPPFTKDEKELFDDDPKYAAVRGAWRKIPSCPFCGTETALRIFTDHGDKILGHVCTNSKCNSNGGGWKPLPFYIVDEDIYDLSPSVLLGTVDKLALIGHSGRTIRKVFGMFGAAPWYKPENGRLHVPDSDEQSSAPSAKGYEGLFPAYANGKHVFADPFPSLIIQDEAHLLDESLGTFAGLFESTLDAVFAYLASPLKEIVAKDSQGRRRRAKVIAASATVSDPQRQLEHLYQRPIPAIQFPEPGPRLYESFYATPDKAAPEETERRLLLDVELASKQARVYTAFMTNGKPHTATSIAILSSFHLTITRAFDALVSGDALRTKAFVDEMLGHVSAGPLQDLHLQRIAAASPAELATLVDLHRIALTYVTNKKGGDQIMAAEAEETRKRHLNVGIELDCLDTRLITGSVEQGEIQGVVNTAQTRVDPGEPFPPLREQMRSVIATSAISHGVDVDEFNSMFFAGMPPDIAEYIQASSRVGRAHIGFVLLIPTPQRRRDRHIVHVFDIFHRFLERMVQPAAIDRWADKAIERVFPSVLQAYLLGVLPSCQFITAPEAAKKEVRNYSYIPIVRQEYKERGEAFQGEIDRFLELAIGITGDFKPPAVEHYKKKLFEKLRDLLSNTWAAPVWSSGMVENFFKGQTDPMSKPMTSLRDVDQGGLIVLSPRDSNGKYQRSEQTKVVMDLVRHGVAGADDSESAEA
jgi:hypothetical protein